MLLTNKNAAIYRAAGLVGSAVARAFAAALTAVDQASAIKGAFISNLHVAASNDVAFCHSLNRMSATKIDGEKMDLWIRWTAGLRKIGGDWKIIHEHESVPFYMDGSYRAKP